MLIGVDLKKDPAILEPAYDDAQGVTAAFNKNLLVRANRELGADFDTRAFDHQAVWNASASRMEMHLVALGDMVVHLGDRPIAFHRGETIHTENSRKFTREGVEAMANAAGWRVTAFETGPAPSVALALLES
jgi:uncharacterized SAM-dependent methyltransferase